MRWLIALVLLGGSGYVLYRDYARLYVAKEPQPKAASPAEAAPAAPPQPLLTVEDLKKVKRAMRQAGDPEVRWTALQLLWSFKDPDAFRLMTKAVTQDPDPQLRAKAIKLLSATPDPERVPGLVKALSDSEKDVRLAAVRALGEHGDPATAPWVVEALKDTDPEVKAEALRTLGRFHERRKKEFQELSDRLRHEHEAAVKRAEKARTVE